MPRFRGDMMSMTGMSSGQTSASGPAFAQTALGLQSRIGENWQLGFRGNLHGQALTLFIITVAACEAGIALALILMLYRQRRSLDVSLWQDLREPGQEPAVDEEPLPPEETIP